MLVMLILFNCFILITLIHPNTGRYPISEHCRMSALVSSCKAHDTNASHYSYQYLKLAL